MWASALKTYEDPATNYLFFPEHIAKADLSHVRKDLTKHRLALQPNKHVHIWTTIAGTLNEYYDSDPRNIIKEAELDAGKLIKLLQVQHKKKFPYLSGPKLSNYWPYILSMFTDVKFSNSQEISIIPDTHVIKSSVELGVTRIGDGPSEVEIAWGKLLNGTGISPTQVHPVLWNWSRNGFKPRV